MIGNTTGATAKPPPSAPTRAQAENAEPSVDVAPSTPTLGGDILQGVEAIAVFLFGDARLRRRVYHLTSATRFRMPHFKLGSIVCARRSVLLRWIGEQENRG